MTRYLESLFSHKLFLAIPVAVAVLAAAAYVIIQPPAYQSTAKLWVNWSGGTQTAADAQVASINQLLATKSFDVQVAQSGPLAKYLDSTGGGVTGVRSLIAALSKGGHTSSGPASADTIFSYLSARVTSVAVGPQIVSVTVTGPTPQIAQGTASALLNQLRAYEIAARHDPQAAQLTYYQGQLKLESAALTADLGAVQQYLAAHPGLVANSTLANNDSQYALLTHQAAIAGQTYDQLLTTVNQIENQIAPGQAQQSDPFTITDSPNRPSTQSRFGKKEVLGLAAGLLAGLVVSLLLLATLVRLDATIHDLDEVLSRLDLEPAGSIPLVRMP